MTKRAKRSAVPSRTANSKDIGGFKLSELDERIKKLNHEGLSLQQISIALKAEGIKLSKSSVCEHLKEMRLMDGNEIRANFKRFGGIPREKRAMV